MNDFFDNLGKAAKDAAKKAMKVSGDAVELTKASVNIKIDEMKRESFFKEIGKLVYDDYKNGAAIVNENVVNFCKCIDEIETEITEQRTKAADISNKKFCVNCGVRLDKYVNYCYSCGAKQPEIVEEEECCEDSDCCCCDTDTDDCCGCSEDENETPADGE